MYKGIIYKYKSPSGKYYIGQTLHEKNRRRDFLNENKDYSGPKINSARNKYGVLNFDYEVIFRVESKIQSEVHEILNDKEIQYIELFDSLDNGYNLDVGGKSASYTRTEETKKKNSEATRKYFENNPSHTAREVVQYSIEGLYIDEWDSARSAAEALQKEGSTITNVCKRKRNHSNGFIWRYKEEVTVNGEVLERIDVSNINASITPVKQYTLDGKFVKQWRTVTEAAEELGYSIGNFSTYCNGRKNHVYKGFKYYRKNYPE